MMNVSRFAATICLAAVLAFVACAAYALVDPSLQPSHLVERHNQIIAGTITRVDDEARLITFKVTHVSKGSFEPKEVVIEVPANSDAAEDAESEDILAEATEGAVLVAFVDKRLKRHEHEVLVYLGHLFYGLEMKDKTDRSRWVYVESHGDRMHGTYNGQAEQLSAMMRDFAAGTAFFPPLPFTRFKDDLEVGKLDGPVRGVALYDIDGDGDLDIYACSPAGGKAYLQTDVLKFQDATDKLGLTGVKSASCSFADVNGDGMADMLADGIILLARDGGFAASSLLPPQANENVLCASFVEVNGDGYPDVIVSRKGGGICLYLNSAVKGGAFVDATKAAGLDSDACGAGGTGFFAPGDFNADGRTDLYYGAGAGLLLAQDKDGKFAPTDNRLPFDFKAPGSKDLGLTGAGGFSPQWSGDSRDLVVAGDSFLLIARNDGGKFQNVAGWGNESQLAAVSQIATLTEDLNMDGHVDIFTISREGPNTFHTNRGYGSYMVEDLYAQGQVFPERAYNAGAYGAAAGDVDNDGANDLLLGGADGVVRLAVSDVLSQRAPTENPTLQDAKLQQTRVLTVRVRRNVGVLGAEVTLADAAGNAVARRVIGSQVLTGCRGPDTVNIAVRERGRHVLSVRYSDGQTHRWQADLAADGPQRVVIDTQGDAEKRLQDDSATSAVR